MVTMINASGLKKGGGLQVADSICRDLSRFPQYRFIVVLPDCMGNTADVIEKYGNVKLLRYNSNNGLKALLTGRDCLLDRAVSENGVDVVLSVFGPVSWMPRCPHLCGFARPHLVLTDSPYFTRMTRHERIKNGLLNKAFKFFFCRGVAAFFTENAYITRKWQEMVGKTKVYTVTNNYHQVYDFPEEWQDHALPAFVGLTLLCIAANYPHKNLEIAIEVARNLKKMDANFKFRFVFTIEKEQYPALSEELKPHFCFVGGVDIRECPSLYRQSDIMFQPSLLECFTATYPEAMRMEVPIVTTNMEFARGLCDDAAAYYSPLDARAAAEIIYKVATDSCLRAKLVENGKKQLLKYDTYEQRTEKLIGIAESLVRSKKTRMGKTSRGGGRPIIED